MAKIARIEKNIDKRIDELTETMIKQVALLHLPRNFKGDGLTTEDIDSIVDLSFVPIREIVIGVLNATTIGFQGEGEDEDEDDDDTKKTGSDD